MKKVAVYTAMMISGMLVSRLNAQQCLNSDLHGAYSFEASGTFNGVPFAAAGQTIYNADGTADGVIQASVGGTVYPAAPWTATYSFSPMTTGGGKTVCVLTKTITINNYGPLTVSFFGTASDGMNELQFIATAASTATNGSVALTITGTARKL